MIREDTADSFVDRAYEIEEKFGAERARSFYRYASGQVTPLKEHLEIWLSEKDFSGRTKRDHGSTIKDLERWCREHIIEATLEAVTRKVAGRFISEHLTTGRVTKTMDNGVCGRWRGRRDRSRPPRNIQHTVRYTESSPTRFKGF